MKKQLGVFLTLAMVLAARALWAAEKPELGESGGDRPPASCSQPLRFDIRTGDDLDTLEAMAHHKANLEVLEVYNLNEDQMKSLSKILSNFQNLIHLSLIGCECDDQTRQKILAAINSQKLKKFIIKKLRS